MDITGIAVLCVEAQAGRLLYREHVGVRNLQRDQPDRDDISYILCDNDPQIIEPYPDDPRGRSCLVWGTIVSGRIAHVQSNYPPGRWVITTYWPDLETKWLPPEYKVRIR